MFKNSVTIFYGMILLLFGTAQAEQLIFQVGSHATYRVYNKLESNVDIFNENSLGDSNVILDFDLTILSANPKTQSYPFDVELTLRGISVHETYKDADETITTLYDSHSMTVSDPELATYFLELIDVPLYFRVVNENKVTEYAGGYLTKLAAKNSGISVYGSSPSSYEVFLMQLFQLSGKDLLPNKSYPSSCYQLIDFEDDKYELNPAESVLESCAYTIKSTDPKYIKGNIKGAATINDRRIQFNAKVSIEGEVVWNVSNPLIQKRKWSAEIEESYKNLFSPLDSKVKVQQRWESTS